MASDLTGETVELLQTLIRNQCVNDGHRRVRLRDAQRRRPADLRRGRRRRHRALGADARPRLVRRPHPGHRSRGALAVPDGSHRRRARQRRRLAARPVRRRADRRRGVGPRRGRHAQPHGVDGGRVPLARAARLPAQGRPAVLRRRRRGGGQRPRRALGGRRAPRRHPLRLPADRERRSASRQRGQSQHRRERRREGRGVATAAGARHAGPRLDAVRLGQRTRQGGQGRVAARRVPPRRRASTSCGAGRWRRSGSTTT